MSDDSGIQIPLTKGYVAIVDQSDADLAELKWSALIIQTGGVYAHRCVLVSGKVTMALMHRIVLARILGRSLTEREEVDHADRDGLNNMRHNLRLATHWQNAANRRVRADSLSGVKGVQWAGGKKPWIASVWRNHRRVYYARFANIRDAIIAYNEAALEHFGEFALLNEVPPVSE